MGIKIEKGIPIPELREKRTKYPWREMEIGDSFFIACKDEITKRRLQASLNGSFTRHKPRKFVTRKDGDGIRCWRVE